MSGYKKFNGLVKKTAAAFSMKMVAAVFGFLLNVVLARQLGATGTGVFYLVLSCISIAIMVGQFGLGQSLLRFVSVGSSQEDWVAVKGVLKLSHRICLIVSFFITIIIYFSAQLLATYVFHKEGLEGLIKLMALAIIPGALYVLNGYTLQGLNKIKSSIFINGVSTPMFGTAMMLVFIPFFGVKGAVLSFVLSAWFTVIVSYYLLRTFAPQLTGVKSDFAVSTLLQSNVPLFWVSLAQLTMVWSSSIMLGVWGTESDVGIFSIANKVAILISFILSCVNTVIAPKFAALYQAGNRKELQEVSVQATVLLCLISTPVLLVLMVYPALVLSIFGGKFIEGVGVLRILALGQFMYVVTGAVGFLLTMSGKETVMRSIMVFSAFLLVGMNFVLIPRFGAMGAAVATSISLVAQNLIIVVAVWRIIGVSPLPIVRRRLL